MSIPHKLSYRVKAIPQSKLQQGLFLEEIDELTLTFIQKYNGSKIFTVTYKNGGFILFCFKIYYRGIIINPVWYWRIRQTHRSIEQNRVQK